MGQFNKDKYHAAIDGIAKKGLSTLGPRVTVLPYDEDTVTAGGIVIPPDSQKKPATGTIIQLGQGFEVWQDELGETHLGEALQYARGLALGGRITFNLYDGKEHTIAITDSWAKKLGLRVPVLDVLVLHAGNLYLKWEE